MENIQDIQTVDMSFQVIVLFIQINKFALITSVHCRLLDSEESTVKH